MGKAEEFRRTSAFPGEATGDGGVCINATDGRVGVVVEKIIDGHRHGDRRESHEGVDDVLVRSDAGSHGVVRADAGLPDGRIAGWGGGLVDDVVEEEVSDCRDFPRRLSGAKGRGSQDGRGGDGNRRAVNRSACVGGGGAIRGVTDGQGGISGAEPDWE